MDDLQKIMFEYLSEYEFSLARQNARMQAEEAKRREELAQKEARLRAWLTETIPVPFVEYATFDGLDRHMTGVTLALPRSFPCSFNVYEAQGSFKIEAGKTPYRVPTRAKVRPTHEHDGYDLEYTTWDGWQSLPAALGRAQWLWREYQPELLAQWAEQESEAEVEAAHNSPAAPAAPPEMPQLPQMMNPQERIALALEVIAAAHTSAVW